MKKLYTVFFKEPNSWEGEGQWYQNFYAKNKVEARKLFNQAWRSENGRPQTTGATPATKLIVRIEETQE